MASQTVKTPAAGSLAISARRFQFRRASCGLHSKISCACKVTPFRTVSEITNSDKAWTGAAAAFLSLSLFACQPASADLNRFEAAAGGEFGVGTAAQYGEAELRGKDFSGQVQIQIPALLLVNLASPAYCWFPAVLFLLCAYLCVARQCCTYVIHIYRTSGGPTLLQRMLAMPASKVLSCKGHTSSRL